MGFCLFVKQWFTQQTLALFFKQKSTTHSVYDAFVNGGRDLKFFHFWIYIFYFSQNYCTPLPLRVIHLIYKSDLNGICFIILGWIKRKEKKKMSRFTMRFFLLDLFNCLPQSNKKKWHKTTIKSMHISDLNLNRILRYQKIPPLMHTPTSHSSLWSSSCKMKILMWLSNIYS